MPIQSLNDIPSHYIAPCDSAVHRRTPGAVCRPKIATCFRSRQIVYTRTLFASFFENLKVLLGSPATSAADRRPRMRVAGELTRNWAHRRAAANRPPHGKMNPHFAAARIHTRL